MRYQLGLLSVCVALAACADDSASPAIAFDTVDERAAATRPWTRWWWPGGAVEDAVLASELQWMADVGFGGVEVQAFDAALDPDGAGADPAAHDVTSAAFRGHVAAAIDAADAAGIGVDLTLGSGWPTGGGHVDAADALTTLMWWEKTVQGPIELDERPLPQPSVFYTVAQIAETALGERLGRFMPELAVPVAAYAAPIVSGSRQASPLIVDDTVTLDFDRIVDLADGWVDGRLTGRLPAGRWHLVAIFAGPNGEYITLTAEPGDPFAVDPLDGGAVRANADALFDGLEGAAPAWRGVFNDSLEFKVDRLYTDDFLAEFEARRGYALDGRILTALTQSADSFLLDAGRVEVAPEFAFGPDDDRMRWDYRQTVSELFTERFVAGNAAWASERGLEFRSQSYGIDVDVIAAAGAAHVPETETLYAGGANAFYKVASSAAHQFERPRASAEAFSFILRDHMTTPLKVRIAADKLFVAGINDLVFHGVPYPTEGAYGLPGWTPFSSPFGGTSTFASTFGPRWEFADSLPSLNAYIARSQLLLREGTPAADVLIYMPFHGFPTSLALAESYREPLLGGHFDGFEPENRDVPFADVASVLGPPVEDPRVTWMVEMLTALAPLEDAGLTWEWTNAERLASAEVVDGRLRIGGASYGGVLVHGVDALPNRAMGALERIADAGGAVALHDADVSQSPSFGEAALDGDIATRFAGLRGHASVRELDELAGLIDAWEWAVRVEGGTGRVLQRRVEDVDLFLVWNPSGTPQSITLVGAECAEATVYDAWSDDAFATESVDGGARLHVPEYSARFVACGQGGADPAPVRATGATVALGDWDVSATPALGGDPIAVQMETLVDWRDVPELALVSGRATYVANFEWDGGSAWLSFGAIVGTAEVFIDDAPAGVLVTAPWQLDLGRLAVGAHTLRVEYTPPLRNELVAAGVAEDPLYAQFLGKEDTTIATGLLGEASIIGGAP